MNTKIIEATFTLVTMASLSGCALRETNSKTAALIEDNDQIAALEQDVEGSLEEPLSPMSLRDGSNDIESGDVAAEAALQNAGEWFLPAGCLASVRERNVVTHTFDGCIGPRGRALSGVLVSTWSYADGAASVLHEAEGFLINGAKVDHQAHIEYRTSEGKLLRERTSSTVGETGARLAIDHSARVAMTYDVASGCTQRNGEAEVDVAGRRWSRVVEGWKSCGDRFACPSAGIITMSGPRGAGRIEVTSSGVYDLTVADRTDTDRLMLWCSPE